MGKKITRIAKSALAFTLAICMVFDSALPVMASNKQSQSPYDVDGNGVINYVSFGDSVTNGYGMEGYREGGINQYGFKREVETAYPAMVSNYLAETTDLPVDFEQLAISGYRMDELNAMLSGKILDGSFVGDEYYYDTSQMRWWNQSAVEGWRQTEPEAASKYAGRNDYDAIISEEYIAAVEKADVITINLGTNNFGNITTSTLQYIMGLKASDYKKDFTQFMDEATYKSMDAMLSEMVAEMVGTGDAYNIAKQIADSLMYGYLCFTKNFDEAMANIYRLNPNNPKIIVVDVYNMMNGVEMVGDTFNGIDLAQMYQLFINLANLYTREQSPYAQLVTHASLTDEPELFIDYYAEETLHPTAEKLLHEFIMEQLGYDAERFENEILSSINTLDALAENIALTVKDNVIKAIVDGVDVAVTNVDAAIAGALEAEGKVNEAVAGVKTAADKVKEAKEGVTLAESLLPIVVDEFLGQGLVKLLFKGSQTEADSEAALRDTLYGEVANKNLADFGFNNDPETIQMIADEIYEVAIIYYDEINYNGGTEEDAEKLAIIEAVRFVLSMQGDPDALNTAQMAYKLNEVAEESGDDEAVLQALTLAVGEDTAKLALQIDSIYQESGEAAAIKAAMATQVDEATAEQAYAIYSNYKALVETGKTEAEAKGMVIAGVVSSVGGYPENIAISMYKVFVAEKAQATPDAADVRLILMGMGLTEDLAKSVYNCAYADDYTETDFDNTMTALIFLNDPSAGLEGAMNSYGMYCGFNNIASTFSKVAKNKTIYVDSLLGEAISSDELASMGTKFMSEDFMNVPGEDASEEEWSTYKRDSGLATMYLRFITQTGVYCHPNEVGQNMLFDAVKDALENLNTSEGADEIVIPEDATVLSIGDSIAKGTYLEADEKNYGELVAEGLDAEYSEFAYDGMRVNEIRALLDPTYSGDNYTETVLGDNKQVLSADLQNKVKESDVILLNVGAMNLGFSALELQKYITSNETYPMTFSSIGAMDARDLGQTVDGILSGFKGGVESLGAAPVLLMFESHGYGFTMFVDSINETVDGIRALNEDATIVLVGLYDFLGDAYFEDASGLYFSLGDYYDHASTLMDSHLKNYADMHKNCIYVDVKGVETSAEKINLAEANNIAAAMVKAHPTANGHTYIKNQILTCDVFGHKFVPTWTWNEDDYSAEVVFKMQCKNCTESESEMSIKPEVEAGQASCESDGETVYTVTTPDGKYTDTRTVTHTQTGHKYAEIPTWEWVKDANGIVTGQEATATLACTNNGCTHELEATATLADGSIVEETTADPACGKTGEITYTATVTLNNKEFNTSEKVESAALGHSYGEPEWTWEGYESATVTFECTKCDGETEGHTYEAPAVIESVTEATAACETPGKVNHTASYVLNDKTYTSKVNVETVEALEHKYPEEPEWAWTEGYAATATFACVREKCEYEKTPKVEVTYVKTDATCTKDGQTVYTAKTEFDSKTFEAVKTVVHEATKHAYGEVVWNWDGYKSATVSVTCSKCEDNEPQHMISENATVTAATTAETCEADGETVYTAAATINGKSVSDVKREKLTALGHTYGKPEWSWEEDHTATAVFTCTRTDCGRTETPEVTVGAPEITDATCKEAGTKVYTAATTFENKDYTDNFTEEIEAKGHSYGEVKFDWTVDESGKVTGAAASTTCLRECGEEGHTLSEKAAISATGDTAVCTEGGEIVYTATVTMNGKEVMATKTITTTAKGHSYGEPEWTWSADNTTAKAAITCVVEGCDEESKDHSVVYDAAVTSETTKATCTKDGKTVYTAVVEGTEYTTTKTIEHEHTGHTYGDIEWDWSDDFEKAKATLTCSVCKDEEGHTISEEVEAEVTKDTATCDTAGVIVHIATVTLGGNVYEDVQNVETTALGHVYGEPEWTWLADNTAAAEFSCTRDNCKHAEKPEVVLIVETTEAACEKDGKIVYTAKVEFEGKTYSDNKTTILPATGHKYEDDICTGCGEKDPDSRPDAAGDCVTDKAAELVSGAKLTLMLNGTNVGTYTFTQNGDGWTIQTEDGKYVALESGNVVYSDSAFTWTYADGRFSATETTTTSGNSWGGSFGGSFGSWFDKLFGTSSTTTTTYYLAASGNALTVSTETAGTTAAFATKVTGTSHSYDDGLVVAPACAMGGYTLYTCTACGNTVKMHETEATGHSYTEKVVAPTCTEAGYTEHVCAKCNDKYTDTPVEATGHKFVDDVCSVCGAKNKIEVEVEKEVSLSEGTLELRINGTSVGKYTFAKSGSNWTIKNSEGKYVALENGKIAYSDSPFEWTYSNGKFSAKSSSSSSSGNSWGGSWGGSFGGGWGGSSSRNRTYYLTVSNGSLSVSTSSRNVTVTFFTTEIQLVDPEEKPEEDVTPDTPVNPEPEQPEDTPTNPEPEQPEEDDDDSSSSGSNWFENLFGGSFGGSLGDIFGSLFG